jgi:type VI secretion system protein VasJ
MLTNLLKALFPARDPEQLERERVDAWSAWLQPLSGDAATGIGRDPGYEDAFFVLKDEVAKLSGIDDALIVNVCQQLLQTVGKDLRVAGYYTFARLRLDGPAGFAQGLELTAALVERFGEALLPARAEAKKGALEWPASTRMVELLSVHGEFAPADLERAVGAIDLIVSRTAQWQEAARPDLQPLVARFERRGQERPEEAQLPAGPASAAGPGAASAIVSTRDLLEQTRTMAAYLRNQENGYLPAVRVVRGVRWDTLHEVPPADVQSRTRLAPPRPELRQQMKRLVLQKQWHELLERVETTFMEGANHLWFDLQYFQHVALDHAGSPYDGWRELLRADFALFLERMPGIERLSFSDGTPFADDATLEWIARHAVVRDLEAGESVAPLPVSADTEDGAAGDWPEIEAQARDMVANQSLEAAFAWLEALPGVHNERQRYLQRLVMARLAEQTGRTETAYALLDSLDTLARTLPVTRWEPSLIFDVRHQLVRTLKTLGNRKDQDKAMLARRIAELQAEMTVMEPARMLSLGQ